MNIIKSYDKLILISNFEERFEYLKLGGVIGRATFGFERYLNQHLYQCHEWKSIRNKVILRDNGCDLGIKGREIFGRLMVHHINPITIDNIRNGDDCVFDMNNLISSSFDTHNAIHFGDVSLLPKLPIERKKGDTTPWTKVYLRL